MDHKIVHVNRIVNGRVMNQTVKVRKKNKFFSNKMIMIENQTNEIFFFHSFNHHITVIDCGQPDSFPNGYIEIQSTTIGSTIYFYCFDGMIFDGQYTNSTCTINGTWNPYPFPKCMGKYIRHTFFPIHFRIIIMVLSCKSTPLLFFISIEIMFYCCCCFWDYYSCHHRRLLLFVPRIWNLK